MLRLDAYEEEGEHALPQPRGVDERQHPQDAGLLQAAHPGADRALGDADAARDVAERAPSVGLQGFEDRLVDRIEHGLRHA